MDKILKLSGDMLVIPMHSDQVIADDEPVPTYNSFEAAVAHERRHNCRRCGFTSATCICPTDQREFLIPGFGNKIWMTEDEYIQRQKEWAS